MGLILNALTTMTPMKAAELVEAAGIEDARRIIADFAAAGLVKSYALVIETIDARGVSTCLRGATIPTEVWQRVVLDGIADNVWTGGTVRVAGGELIGSAPASVVTGITFNAKHIDWLISHHDGAPKLRRTRARPSQKKKPAQVVVASPPASGDDHAPLQMHRRKPDPGAIPPGALLATIGQTMKALGLSRGTINNLLKRGTLVRKETGLRSVSIEVASIQAFAGTGFERQVSQ